MKDCKYCDEPFQPNRPSNVYCSVRCRWTWNNKRKRERVASGEIPAQRHKPEYHREYALKRKYGLTLAEWEAMFDEQGRVCRICRSDETTGKGWHTDHDHQTGVVRGILCYDCNIMLGHAKDSITRLEGAVAYLLNHESATNLTKGDV